MNQTADNNLYEIECGFEETLRSYLRGDIRDQEMRRLVEHAQHCVRCGAVLEASDEFKLTLLMLSNDRSELRQFVPAPACAAISDDLLRRLNAGDVPTAEMQAIEASVGTSVDDHIEDCIYCRKRAVLRANCDLYNSDSPEDWPFYERFATEFLRNAMADARLRVDEMAKQPK